MQAFQGTPPKEWTPGAARLLEKKTGLFAKPENQYRF